MAYFRTQNGAPYLGISVLLILFCISVVGDSVGCDSEPAAPPQANIAGIAISGDLWQRASQNQTDAVDEIAAQLPKDGNPDAISYWKQGASHGSYVCAELLLDGGLPQSTLNDDMDFLLKLIQSGTTITSDAGQPDRHDTPRNIANSLGDAYVSKDSRPDHVQHAIDCYSLCATDNEGAAQSLFKIYVSSLTSPDNRLDFSKATMIDQDGARLAAQRLVNGGSLYDPAADDLQARLRHNIDIFQRCARYAGRLSEKDSKIDGMSGNSSMESDYADKFDLLASSLNLDLCELMLGRSPDKVDADAADTCKGYMHNPGTPHIEVFRYSDVVPPFGS